VALDGSLFLLLWDFIFAMTIPSSLTPPPIAPSVLVRWLVPNRVIYVEAAGAVDARVSQWIGSEIVSLIHSCSTARVHLLGDVRGVTSLSPNLNVRGSSVLTHPRRGYYVTVGATQNRALARLLVIVMNLIGLQYRDYATFEDALTFLSQSDPSLPDLSDYLSPARS
jgi:hypothetical protein